MLLDFFLLCNTKYVLKLHLSDQEQRQQAKLDLCDPVHAHHGQA
jgi:hypothetical protein